MNANGSLETRQESASKIGLMVALSEAITSKEKSRVSVFGNGQIMTYTKATGRRIKFQVSVFTDGPMDVFTKESI